MKTWQKNIPLIAGAALVIIAALAVIAVNTLRSRQLISALHGVLPERLIAFGSKEQSVAAIDPVQMDAVLVTQHWLPATFYINGKRIRSRTPQFPLSDSKSHFHYGNTDWMPDQVCAQYATGCRRLLIQTIDKKWMPVLTVYDTATGKAVWTHAIEYGRCAGIAISHDGRFAAAAGMDQANVWEIKSGHQVCHLSSINSSNVAFSPDDSILYVCGEVNKQMARSVKHTWITDPNDDTPDWYPGYVEAWRLSDRRLLWRDYVRSGTFDVHASPEGRFLAVCGTPAGGDFYSWKLTGGMSQALVVDAATGAAKWASPISDYEQPYYDSNAFSPNGRFAAFFGGADLCLVDLQSMKQVRHYIVPFLSECGGNVAFTADSQHLISAGSGQAADWYIGDI
jgi:hypothetical protein